MPYHPLTSREPSKPGIFFSGARVAVLWVVSAIILALSPQFTLADEDSDSPIDMGNIQHLLLAISQQIQTAQMELEEIQQSPRSPGTNERQLELQAEIDQLNRNLEAIATQHSTEEFILSENKKTDWFSELEELTLPLLHAISDLTEKPRRIDKLKKRIKTLKGQLTKYQQATQNLNELIELQGPAINPDSASAFLNHRLEILKNKYSPEITRFQYEEARKKLHSELEDKQSFVDMATDNLKEFFRHRGRNLLIVISLCLVLGWFLSTVRKWIVGKRSIFDFSPWLKKVLRAAYNLVVVLFCTVTGLVTLYFLNDWLLLSLVIIILLGLSWTFRQLIPVFFQEIRLALNLGTVRENERLIWNGVPWLVKGIGINVHLVNNLLEGGNMKLPLYLMIDQVSRPNVKSEPWFPTHIKDWVLLSDGTYGKIERQTQDQIVVRLKGDAFKYYPTKDFLNLIPTNLSNGFRYEIDFPLDLDVREKICDDLPDAFTRGIKSHLQHHFDEKDPNFPYLEVAFDRSDSSFLYLKILIHVKGASANRYEENRREIFSALIRIINEQGLAIPNTKLAVNVPAQDLNRGSSTSNLPYTP